MKICILSIVNIKHMSLISLYTSFFEENGIDYDIIYVDKYNEDEPISAKNIYKYALNIDRNWSKLRKVLLYYGFKNYAEEIINANEYDYIIVWRSETALLFADYLSKGFKNNYCINIRDYCWEKNWMVYRRIKKVISNSGFTTISSDGYRSFLPDFNYLTVHSFNSMVLERCKPRNGLRMTSEPIRMCFIGYIRFFDNDKKLIDSLANDPRYIVQYFGEGSEFLQQYAKEKEVLNVEFYPGFQIEQTASLLDRGDVINNLYGYNDIALDTAISTKYYYALYLNLPILVFRGTYMEELSRKVGIGFAVDEKDYDELGNDFYEWYHSLDFEQIRENCEREIYSIHKANQMFNAQIKRTFLE